MFLFLVPIKPTLKKGKDLKTVSLVCIEMFSHVES
jgi:hypothetical protein